MTTFKSHYNLFESRSLCTFIIKCHYKPLIQSHLFKNEQPIGEQIHTLDPQWIKNNTKKSICAQRKSVEESGDLFLTATCCLFALFFLHSGSLIGFLFQTSRRSFSQDIQRVNYYSSKKVCTVFKHYFKLLHQWGILNGKDVGEELRA